MKLHVAKPEELDFNNRITTPLLLITTVVDYAQGTHSQLVMPDEFDLVCKDIQEYYNSTGYTIEDIRSCVLKLNTLRYGSELDTELLSDASNSINTFDFGEDRIIMARDYFNCLMEVL